MTIKPGDKVPSVTLKWMGPEGFGDVTTDDLFKGKKVALFGVPGAYTPTCSAQHLPGFVEKAGELKAKGIDDIVCMAVNDAFVMGAWGKVHGTEGKVTMVGDGNAELTAAMGIEMDAAGFGMGTRCQRFSMLVDDGVVKSVAVEEPGAFEVSSAEKMLEQL